MDISAHILKGQAIPALPLALDSGRRFSERHERALVRYYVSAGCGGLAVAAHSTQFEIRDPEHALFQPVLELASEAIDEAIAKNARPFAKIAGVCGLTPQAQVEAALARSLGYHAVLLSLAAWKAQDEKDVLAHCTRIGEILPLVGFYLQPAVGGRPFSYRFWRAFCEIPSVIAIKIAPFNRYQTLDVVRAVAESGRNDIALYTGNDDSIVVDLLTSFRFDKSASAQRIQGGLLGHWGVWSHAAVLLFNQIQAVSQEKSFDKSWLTIAAQVTDMNAAVFDSANSFRGCIPGILEVLRRQRLVPTNFCLNPTEALSPGQSEEIDRVSKAYPQLTDDEFVAEHLDDWLA